MNDVLKEAFAKVTALPNADQESIGRELLSHVERLKTLRDDIDRGVRSLDEGKGKAVAIDEIVRLARQSHSNR